MTPKPYLSKYWLDPRVEVRPSAIHSNGLFARAPFIAGEIVEIMGGEVMTQAEFEAFIRTTSRYNAVQIGEGLHLVERSEVTAARAGSLPQLR